MARKLYFYLTTTVVLSAVIIIFCVLYKPSEGAVPTGENVRNGRSSLENNAERGWRALEGNTKSSNSSESNLSKGEPSMALPSELKSVRQRQVAEDTTVNPNMETSSPMTQLVLTNVTQNETSTSTDPLEFKPILQQTSSPNEFSTKDTAVSSNNASSSEEALSASGSSQPLIQSTSTTQDSSIISTNKTAPQKVEPEAVFNDNSSTADATYRNDSSPANISSDSNATSNNSALNDATFTDADKPLSSGSNLSNHTDNSSDLAKEQPLPSSIPESPLSNAAPSLQNPIETLANPTTNQNTLPIASQSTPAKDTALIDTNSGSELHADPMVASAANTASVLSPSSNENTSSNQQTVTSTESPLPTAKLPLQNPNETLSNTTTGNTLPTVSDSALTKDTALNSTSGSELHADPIVASAANTVSVQCPPCSNESIIGKTIVSSKPNATNLTASTPKVQSAVPVPSNLSEPSKKIIQIDPLFQESQSTTARTHNPTSAEMSTTVSKVEIEIDDLFKSNNMTTTKKMSANISTTVGPLRESPIPESKTPLTPSDNTKPKGEMKADEKVTHATATESEIISRNFSKVVEIDALFKTVAVSPNITTAVQLNDSGDAFVLPLFDGSLSGIVVRPTLPQNLPILELISKVPIPKPTDLKLKPLNILLDYESSLLAEGTTPGCLLEDRERYRRNVQATTFSMLNDEPTMLIFSKNSSCVGTLNENGKRTVRSIGGLLPNFPRNLQVDVAGFINGKVYIMDSSKTQNVWGFDYDSQTKNYRKHLVMTRDAFLKVCDIRNYPKDLRITAFTQVSLRDPTCLVFDDSGSFPLLSVNATNEAKSLAEAISNMIVKQFIPYVESVYSWLNEPYISTMYIFESNGDVYRLFRKEASTGTGSLWKKGDYQILPYNELPLPKRFRVKDF